MRQSPLAGALGTPQTQPDLGAQAKMGGVWVLVYELMHRYATGWGSLRGRESRWTYLILLG